MCFGVDRREYDGECVRRLNDGDGDDEDAGEGAEAGPAAVRFLGDGAGGGGNSASGGGGGGVGGLSSSSSSTSCGGGGVGGLPFLPFSIVLVLSVFSVSFAADVTAAGRAVGLLMKYSMCLLR